MYHNIHDIIHINIIYTIMDPLVYISMILSIVLLLVIPAMFAKITVELVSPLAANEIAKSVGWRRVRTTVGELLG